MWDTFLPDLLIAFIGAIFTVAIAYATYMLNAAQEEARALNSLIAELHRRRALRPSDEQPIRGAASSDDYDRVNQSVLSMRSEIRAARDRVGQRESIQLPLSEMRRACNTYLRRSAAQPELYARFVGDLRRELDRQVEKLAAARKGVNHLVPGEGAGY